MKKADWILVVCIALFSGLIWLLCCLDKKQRMQDTGAQVVITIDGAEYQRASLTEEVHLYVPTADGDSEVVISGGSCYMERAHCPDQICVRHKPVMAAGESIICLPYKIVVSIEGSGEAEYDN